MKDLKFQSIHQHYKTGKIVFYDWGPVEGGFVAPSSVNGYKLIGHRKYTGLKDKNGKEIYEGDIIKANVGEDLREFRLYKTCFNRGCFGLRDIRETENVIYGFTPFITQDQALHERGFFELEIEDVLQIVGNIYETPELLKP